MTLETVQSTLNLHDFLKGLSLQNIGQWWVMGMAHGEINLKSSLGATLQHWLGIN